LGRGQRVSSPPQGSNASCKILESPAFVFFKIRGPGKSWKLKFKALESPGKIVATRCHILRLKYIKFDFGCRSAPDPALGELTVLPQIP